MRCGDIIFHAFDPVKVRLSIDSSNIQHEKLTFELVEPYIENFSVKLQTNEDSVKMETDEANKRKSDGLKGGKKNKKKKSLKK